MATRALTVAFAGCATSGSAGGTARGEEEERDGGVRPPRVVTTYHPASVQPFDRVTVECHPRLVGRRWLEFADHVRGRLEVAMDLETADAAAFG